MQVLAPGGHVHKRARIERDLRCGFAAVGGIAVGQGQRAPLAPARRRVAACVAVDGRERVVLARVEAEGRVVDGCAVDDQGGVGGGRLESWPAGTIEEAVHGGAAGVQHDAVEHPAADDALSEAERRPGVDNPAAGGAGVVDLHPFQNRMGRERVHQFVVAHPGHEPVLAVRPDARVSIFGVNLQPEIVAGVRRVSGRHQTGRVRVGRAADIDPDDLCGRDEVCRLGVHSGVHAGVGIGPGRAIPRTAGHVRVYVPVVDALPQARRSRQQQNADRQSLHIIHSSSTRSSWKSEPPAS